MAASTWKGYLSFGVISVPIRLYAAARYSHVAFHEIHRKCGTRVRQQLYCPYDKEVVSRDEIAMGFETEKDRYVLADPAELKKLQPPSSTVMEILQFVKLAEVDPIYFETSYFSVPDAAGERAYTLLVNAMTAMECAAIAKLTLHLRERTVIIRPYEKGLILHTIYYPSEIRQVKGYGKSPAKNLPKQETDLATQFAKALLKPFHPEEFHDVYSERVRQLIESKSKGKPAPMPEKAPRLAPVVDLAEALRKSIAESRKTRQAAKPRRLKKTA